MTELGARADPQRDRVEAAGRAAGPPPGARYYVLNKPPHVVATMADPEGRATLRHLLRGLLGGIFPVGRLEYEASGLILLTSDGQFADAIFKASPNLPKVYWMKLKGRPRPETLAEIARKAGARIRLLRAPAAAGQHPANPWYEAEIREPRKDALRQAFFSKGHPVEKIKRVRLGPLELGKLPEGHYRELSPAEVAALRRAAQRAAHPDAATPPMRPAPVRPAKAQPAASLSRRRQSPPRRPR